MSTERKRPRPRALIAIDPNNAYAKLGVSPLATTDEIISTVSDRRASAAAQGRTTTGAEKEAAEAELRAIDEVNKLIGTAKTRAAYDLAHPLHELLTVQRAPRDALFEGGDQSGLVTAWLVSELGRETLLPSAEALPLWAPKGIDAWLVEEWKPFLQEEITTSSTPVSAPEMDAPLTVDQLKAVSNG